MKLLKLEFIFVGVIILFFLIAIFTQYIGEADIGDYAGVAKFFAGEYPAKIRSSHSYFYGFISSPFVKLTQNFLGMKIMSLIWLILLMITLYYISNKNQKTLLLILTAPIFWYMAPLINPIQIASLFFLLGYYFIKKYDEQDKILSLIYAGLFFGLAWVFWDTVLHFGIILTLCFFYNKKLSHLLTFMGFVIIGLFPRLILDQFLFNFTFYTILKSFTGGIVNSLWSGIIGSGHMPKTFTTIFSIFLVLPFLSYLLIKPKYFKENKKTVIFLILSLLLIFSNPQIRYTLIIIPIILLQISSLLTKRQFKIQFFSSIIISILMVAPYLIQISYFTNSPDFSSLIMNFPNIEITKNNQEKIMQEDLNNISKDFPNQKFVVGPLSDDYSILAMLYWEKGISEFVSIQDYELYLNNETVLFEKEFHPLPNINDRREIWIRGGISRKTNDPIDYGSIKYLISLTKQTDLEGFKELKSYKILSVFQKKD